MTTQVSGSVLANTAVTAGVYGGLQIPFITVDAQGRITSAANTSNSTFVISSVGNVGIGTASPSAKLTISGNTSISGNLTFTGTGNRITGDFSNGTVTNRVLFQSSTTNGFTEIGAIPNGTSQQVFVHAYNSSDAANSSYVQMSARATEVSFRNQIAGTGSYLPMTFYTGGSERMRIDTSGNVGIGTSSPVSLLSIDTKNSSNGISVGDFFNNSAPGATPNIQTLGSRNDGNTTFGGRFGAAYRRLDGTAIASTASLGYYAFGGQWGTDTTYQSAKLLYTASVVGVAEGNFTSASAMPTAITFRTGSTGEAITSVNTTYGSERMRIDSSGNVGIGTSSPLSRFNVSGGRTTLAANNEPYSLQLNYGASNNGPFLGSTGLDTFVVSTSGGTERMRIDSSGNVGIGTSSPGQKLDVNGSINANGIELGLNGEAIKKASGSLYVETGSASPIIISTNNAERMRIDSSGNVGIGTASGGAKLDVSVSGAALVQNLQGGSGVYTRLGTTTSSLYTVHRTTDTNIYTAEAVPLWFGTNSLERMRIDSSGNVGIGTSSPSGYKLNVQGGDVNFTGSFYSRAQNYFGATNASVSMQHYTAANWNYSALNLWRNASNTSTPRFLGMPLDGDSDSNTTIGGYNAIWGAYDSSPTTGSTSSGLNGKMVYGAYAGHQWYTNGTERMRIDSSGNVGINTSSPSSFGGNLVSYGSTIVSVRNFGNSGATNFKATAVGDAQGQLAGYSFYPTFQGTGDNGPRRTADIWSGFNGGAWGSQYLAFGVGSAPNDGQDATPERMRIDASGNVGIGTSSPTEKLEVNGVVKLALTSAPTWDTNSYLWSESGVGLNLDGFNVKINTGNTRNERMRIDSAGNVGIGTSSPTVRADIVGASGAARGIALRVATDNGAYIQLTDVASHEWYIGTPNNDNSLVFGTARNTGSDGTERMRIDSSGTLLVGKTTSASDVTTAGAFIAASGKTVLTTAANQSLVLAGLGTGTRNIQDFYLNGSFIGSISVSTSAVAYNTTSDYRLKENVQPMVGALETVAQLKPVTYNWKADGSNGQGFIAHELQAVVPDAVTGEKDAVDKDGKPVYQGIDTSFLVATLTKAIQELSAKVDTLQAELNTLKGN